MLNNRHGLVNAFRSYAANAGRSVFFIGLFYTLWAVAALVTSDDLTLHNFSGRTIGGATLDGYSINARINLFYKALLLFFFGFSVLNVLGYFIFRKAPELFSSTEVKAINYTAVAGIFLLLLQVFSIQVSETMELIYFLHKWLLAGLVLALIFKNTISIYRYALSLCVAISGYFFVNDCALLCGATAAMDFYIATFCIAIVLLLALHLFLRSAADHKSYLLRRYIFIALPVLALPLVSILKDEIILTLKADHKTVESRWPVFLLLVAILAVWKFIRYKRAAKIKLNTEKQQLALSYFPLLVFGLVCYAYYSFYIDYWDELFEMGNVYLPIMEFMRFGILPPLEKLNTHLLSDYFFGGLYSAFSGLKPGEIFLYDFLLAALSYLLHYYLVYYISRNPFIALFCVLLFPFAETLLPFGFCFCVLGIFALNKLIFHQQTFKRYLQFFATLVFLMAWRIDLAYVCVILLPLILLGYHLFYKQFCIQWRLLLKALVSVAATVCLIIGVLCLYRHINLFSKVAYLYNYLLSAQSYGIKVIGNSDSAPYKLHYFIFPVVAAVLFLFMIWKFRSFNRTRSQALAYLSFIIICGVYFLNFNRGLTHHGLIEDSDFFVSYLYLVVAGAPFLLLRKQTLMAKFCVFCALSFLTIMNYHVPYPQNSKSVFESLQAKLKSKVNTNPLVVDSRVTNIPADAGRDWQPFADFVAKNIPGDGTYIDFDNKPVLYFHTGKITPSWFYQNPLCLHNDFLQEKFINDLKDYKTPYLLFSSDLKNYSEVDGVPNVLRHYRLAEYFYQNFEPCVVLGKFGMWKRNSTKAANRCDTLFQLQRNDCTLIKTQDFQVQPGKKYLVKLLTDKASDARLKLFSGNKEQAPELLRLSDTLIYAPLDLATGTFSLAANNVKALFVLQYDYLPDVYAEQFHTLNFKQLPYIWGNYDKQLSSEKTLFEKSLPRGSTHSFSIQTDLDKTTGNTLLLSCTNTGKTKKTLWLLFGNNAEKGRTAILLDVLPSDKPVQYAIRVSCVYKWYSGRVNTISLWADDPENALSITRLKITKGS